MSAPINLIFWGFLLVFLDINLGIIDILPDFIGFILIMNGLTKLESKARFFSIAKPVAFIMIFYSFLVYFRPPQQNTGEFLSLSKSEEWGWMIYDQIGTILIILIVYGVCMGIKQLAEQENFQELKNQAQFRWKLFLLVNVLYLAIVPFSINVPYLISFLVILIIAFVIAFILFLSLLRNAHRQLPFSDQA